jgi:urease accessory protein
VATPVVTGPAGPDSYPAGAGGYSAGPEGYSAGAVVVTRADASGRTRVTRLRSEGPLAARQTPDGIYLVGAAAGPLGGDHLRLDIDAGPGSRLVLRSAAAAVLLPGPRGAPSSLLIHARVGADAHLDFCLRPSVAAAGCDHRVHAAVELAPGATLRWREEIILGRHGEPSGLCVSRLDVTLAGAPLYRGELAAGRPVTDASSAVLAGARAAGSVVLVDAARPQPPAGAGDGLAVLPLAGPGTVVSATAPDAITLTAHLDRGEELAGYHWPSG